MTSVSLSSKTNINRKAIVAVTVLLTSTVGAWQAAGAQGVSAGSYSAANALGPDQDSLLPPEVVPLDPSTANSMTAQQAASRMNDSTGNVPGLVNNNANGMQTAQDFRKSAFDSLYNQGQVAPQGQLTQWRAGQVSQNNVIGQNAPMNQYTPPNQMPSNTQPAQSQTLTGAPKNQPKVRDIRRGGVSNTISALAGFGAGALSASYLFHPQYMPMGLGVFGASMTGFGVRNAFRF